MRHKTEPHWGDIASLALNAAALHKLSTLQESVDKSLALETARLQAEETQKELRRFLFDLETSLERLMPLVETNPSGALLLAWATESNLTKSGLTPDHFDQFSDKDRYQDFTRRLSDEIENITAKTGDDGREAHEVRQYLANAPKVQQAIGRMQRIESAKRNLDVHLSTLAELRREAGQLRSAAGARRRATTHAFMISALVGLTSGCIVGYKTSLGLGVLICVVMTLATAIIFFSYRPEATPEKLKKIEAAIVGCERHIASADTPIASVIPVELNHISVTCSTDLQNYEKNIRERLLAIAPLNGQQIVDLASVFGEHDETDRVSIKV